MVEIGPGGSAYKLSKKEAACLALDIVLGEDISAPKKPARNSLFIVKLDFFIHSGTLNSCLVLFPNGIPLLASSLRNS